MLGHIRQKRKSHQQPIQGDKCEFWAAALWLVGPAQSQMECCQSRPCRSDSQSGLFGTGPVPEWRPHQEVSDAKKRLMEFGGRGRRNQMSRHGKKFGAIMTVPEWKSIRRGQKHSYHINEMWLSSALTLTCFLLLSFSLNRGLKCIHLITNI